MSTTTEQPLAGDKNAVKFLGGSAQVRVHQGGTGLLFGHHKSPQLSVEYRPRVLRDDASDSTSNHSRSANVRRDRITDALWPDRPQGGNTVGFPPGLRSLDVKWLSCRGVVRSSALINTLALEQNAIGFDPPAAAILGRIFDRGHATCEDLADWLESPEEWIAFSRLQRARLLYDSGTEFTVSPAGRRLIREMLSEGDAE